MEILKPVLVLLAALAFAVAPFFTPGFGGYDPGNFPIPLNDPAIVPAGYAFAIWGLIYAALILHAGFGLLARQQDVAWDAVRWPLFIALVLGAGWLAVAKVDPLLATVHIWAMLAASLAALVRAPRIPDRWLLLAPLALFAGWLTAAACVSLGVVLIGYGISDERTATLSMLILAGAIGIGVQQALARAPEYALAIIWALVAVMVGNFGGDIWVQATCAAAIVALVVVAVRLGRRVDAIIV